MITTRSFGTLSGGIPVTCYRLPGGHGAYVDILDYGATIQAIVLPDQAGQLTDVVLGYDTAREYEQGDKYYGATVGRHANRIAGGAFTLNGRRYTLDCNDGPNHLHGGVEGFHRRMFAAEIDGDWLHMRMVSPDGDQGFPGTLRLTVTYAFTRDNRLSIGYRAVTDRDTVLNLTSHGYFDLSGGKNPMGQILSLDAEAFCENDGNTLPTGRLLPVEGTAFDFRTPKAVGRDLDTPAEQLTRCHGYDHNYVLNNGGRLAPCAVLRSPETGIAMEVSTDLPGMQLYSGNFTGGTGKGGRQYRSRDAVCLEPQLFPDAIHQPAFRQPVLRAGDVFRQTIVYRFF